MVAQRICWRGDSTFIQVSKLAVQVDRQTVWLPRSKRAQFVDLLQDAFLLAERANDLDVLARRIALQRPCSAVAHRLYAAKRGSRACDRGGAARIAVDAAAQEAEPVEVKLRNPRGGFTQRCQRPSTELLCVPML